MHRHGSDCGNCYFIRYHINPERKRCRSRFYPVLILRASKNPTRNIPFHVDECFSLCAAGLISAVRIWWQYSETNPVHDIDRIVAVHNRRSHPVFHLPRHGRNRRCNLQYIRNGDRQLRISADIVVEKAM